VSGKGVFLTMQAGAMKHVAFAPMCARYVLAGVEAEHFAFAPSLDPGTC